MTDQAVGNWILEEPIASGGMGSVYRARHKTLGTPAAVKVLQPQLLGAVEMQQRFGREAAIQARLLHPNIARVLDFHEEEGRWYLVMEFLDHGSLTDRLREASGPLPTQQALVWTRQALAGLSHAHQHGIVHRDIKPDNLLFDAHGQVKVADFGIARDINLTRMTQTGMTMGTPHYMSPEQLLRPDEVDERSDVYAMGGVLYELLAGCPPFEGSSFFAISQAKVDKDPPPLSSINPAASPALDAVLQRAMAREPEQRYASCEAFLQGLDAYEARHIEGRGHFGAVAPPVAAPAGAAPPLPRPSSPPVLTVEPVSPPVLTAAQDLMPYQPTHLQQASAQALSSHTRQSGHRGWKVASIGLTIVAVVVAFLLWQLLVGPGTGLDREALGHVLREAHKAEGAARAVESAVDTVESTAEEAETIAQEVLDKPSLKEGPGEVGAAKALLKQARKGAEEAHKAADRSGEAYNAAEQAAQEAGVDLAALPSDDPQLAEVLPRSDPEARQAARDAVEVARLESARASSAADEADAVVEGAENKLEKANDRLADLRPEVPFPPESQQAAELARLKSLQQKQEPPDSFGPGPSLPLGPLPEQPTGQQNKVIPDPRLAHPGPVLPSAPGPLPEQPTVAVLAHGDPVLAASFEQELERRLARAKLDVRDEHNSLEVSQKLQGAQPPRAQELAPELVKSGFHVLVIIRVEEGERRHLEFRDQRGHAVGARLRMNAYNLLSNGTPIGRGWSELVEYTELSAGAKAKRALLKESSELAVAIRDAWKRVRPS